jgi:hypothetical protein
MAKVFIDETTLSSIGDAIRAKTGSSELIAPLDMADEISGITTGGGDIEPIVLSGYQSYGCAGNLSKVYIEKFGNTISTKDLTDASYMFNQQYKLERIPFDLNFNINNNAPINYLFYQCYELKYIPKVNNIKIMSSNNIFNSCQKLREIPEDWCDTWDWSYIENLTSAYSGSRGSMFSNCYSLRKLPMEFLAHGNPIASETNTIYYNCFSNCYTLDEIIGLPFPHTTNYNSNLFPSTFNRCYRLKNMTFALQEDGTPYVMKWKKQTIDLGASVGYGNAYDNAYILSYNSGITADKEVKDDATYVALKNDIDWWTRKIEYSRYNHDSAVATINSLPDTSAYLTTAGGTNTINFNGVAGSKTDGGAINTLTAEEIAVATAKGWTISFK